jgi:membrane-associated phospholipid phosphatase
MRAGTLALLLVASAAHAQHADSVRFSSPAAWVRAYPGHLGDIVAPLGNARTTVLSVAGVAGAVALAHTQDGAIDRWVQDGHTLGGTADFASNTLPFLMFAAYAAGHVGAPLLQGDGRGALSRVEGLVEAVTTQGLIVQAIKYGTRRSRPNGAQYAFPSGHTAYAFTLAGLADAAYGPEVGVPAFAAATLVGASRISLRRHWLSDVVAGAALGTAIGELVGRGHKKGEDDPQLAAGWSPRGSFALTVEVPISR